MTVLDDQIAALEAAIAQGAKRVMFQSGGTRREIEYHSLSEMIDLVKYLKSTQGGRRKITLAAL